MRLGELVRSRTFRLVLINTGVFGAASLLLLTIKALASRHVSSHVDEFVSSEIELFVADYRIDGPRGVLELVQSRDAADHGNHWLYLLVDARGRRIAGDEHDWPRGAPGADGSYTLPSHNGRAGDVRARIAHFPDGSRLLVGLNDYEVTEVRRALGRAIALGLVGMLLFAVVAGLLVTMAALRQLESINRVTHTIMLGDLEGRVPVSAGNDEYAKLGRNINAMLDRIRELMQTVQGVTDNIAHDLRLPLARLRGRLDRAARDDLDVPALRANTESAIEEIDSILRTFGALLRITHVESGALRQSFTPVDLSAIARDAEELFEPIASASGHELRSVIEPDVRLAGSRDLLFQALSNLLDNALKYSPPGSPIEIGLRRRDEATVELWIADRGPGIPPAERQKVFQRMYRLDPSRSTPGNGLGLALVRAVATLHDGHCEIEDNAPGTRVCLRLPAPA